VALALHSFSKPNGIRNLQLRTSIPQRRHSRTRQRRYPRGVYFLASDTTLDITLAFLNSFREHNPEIPLCLIPFGDQTDVLRKLAAKYDFLVFDKEADLRRCDGLSREFFSVVRGHFRKICAFEGYFDEFIYIDCDTIVLQDVSFVFEFLRDYDFVFSHSNLELLRRWVWKDSIFEAGSLTRNQIAFSANTGFFCSRYRAISLDNAEQDLEQAVKLSAHMELYCVEQPYLNYLVVSSGKRYTSLLELSSMPGNESIPLEKWAGGGFFSRMKDSVKHKSTNFFLYHWAGCWMATDLDKIVYRLLGLFWLIRSPTVKIFLPRRRLWRKYRYLG